MAETQALFLRIKHRKEPYIINGMYKHGISQKTDLFKQALDHYGEYQHLINTLNDEIETVEYQLCGVHAVQYGRPSSTGNNEEASINHWYKLLDYKEKMKWVRNVYKLYVTWILNAIDNYIPEKEQDSFKNYCIMHYRNPEHTKFPMNNAIMKSIEECMTQDDIDDLNLVETKIGEIHKKFLPDE